MIYLCFDDLTLIAKIRNISDYENKFAEDLIKAISEKEQETPKQETPKQETPKLETPKLATPKSKILKPETAKPEKTKPENPKIQKPKPKIRVNKKKLKNIRKDFVELIHKFSKKHIYRYRKLFYVA